MKFCKWVLTIILSIAMLGSLLSCEASGASELPAALDDSSNIFSDVPVEADYAQAVKWCFENGLMAGVGGGRFSPEGTLTRAMLAAVLYRAEGEPAVTGIPSFTDTEAGTWYSNAVAWASQGSLLLGYGNNLFGTNDPVTVEQLEVVIGRYMGQKPLWTGDPTRSIPATRAQVAVALYENLALSTAGQVLVAYFSRAGENYNVGTVDKGNTAVVAEIIAEQSGGDLFEIRPVAPYPTSYDEMLTAARNEADSNARPEIASTVEHWENYDTIILGYPIWNGDMPMIVYNFLESYDFSGKTILPFCTHEGSGLSGTQTSIADKCPDASVLTGLAIRGQTAQNSRTEAEQAVKEWLDASGIPDASPNPPGTPTPNPVESTGFDLEKGTVVLNNGIEMPILGIGTYTLSNTQAENSVYWALRDGYRLIDTARIYGNEEGVGRGIQRAIDEGYVKREEIFVTTKMWTSDYSNGAAAIDASLRRLGLDYIDLMILHHSQPNNDVTAYKAMEQAAADGKLRSIGLSNYYTPEDFDRLVNAAAIVPALLQNETHPHYQSGEMKEHLAQYGTVLEAWFPLGGRGHTQELFNDSTISAIAAAHGKTSAQVILRWHLQAGNIAIPGSSNEAHIQENFEIFDFELTDTEMEQIAAMETGQRHSTY